VARPDRFRHIASTLASSSTERFDVGQCHPFHDPRTAKTSDRSTSMAAASGRRPLRCRPNGVGAASRYGVPMNPDRITGSPPLRAARCHPAALRPRSTAPDRAYRRCQSWPPARPLGEPSGEGTLGATLLTLGAPDLNARNGSAAPGRLTKLLRSQVHQMSIRAARPWATALENGRVREAVARWRPYFENGHPNGDFLIDRMTGSGRDRISPRVAASRLCPTGPSR